MKIIAEETVVRHHVHRVLLHRVEYDETETLLLKSIGFLPPYAEARARLWSTSAEVEATNAVLSKAQATGANMGDRPEGGESKTLLEPDVSFKIVRVQRNTYRTRLILNAIDTGFVIDGAVGQHHYATPEALHAGLTEISDRFVEEVTKHRAEVLAKDAETDVKLRETAAKRQETAAREAELADLEERMMLTRIAAVRAKLDELTPKQGDGQP